VNDGGRCRAANSRFEACPAHESGRIGPIRRGFQGTIVTRNRRTKVVAETAAVGVAVLAALGHRLSTSVSRSRGGIVGSKLRGAVGRFALENRCTDVERVGPYPRIR